MEFADRMTYYNELTESMLRVLVAQMELPPVLNDGVVYSLFAGGKRLRPALCLAACECMDGNAADALKAACAIEMVHTYSLIHDDLPAMDNDDMRRGKPSNHRIFGEGNAILAGDGLLSMAMVLLAQTGNAKVFQCAARGALSMVAGQSMDINGKPDAETLFSIHEKKTGALITAAVLAGAHTANANAKQIAALTEFSERFGLLFQITDDILDVTGTSEALGKTVGKDEKDGKVTFVSLYGLESARSEAAHAASAAIEALEPLDTDVTFFTDLVHETLTRQK